jgi:pimeloyl-ACP methyl ester carboxylesterase
LKQGEISYVDHGRGTAALFLHGFPLSSFQWRGVMARLSSQRRCIAPDFLGLGQTRVATGQAVGPNAQVTMIAELLDYLSAPHVDLIANDSGGAVAQLFAVRFPERVRTMLLTNCDVEPDSPPPALEPVIELARAGTYPDEWLAPWVRNPEIARSAEGLGGLTYGDLVHPTDAAIEQHLAPLVSTPERKALVNAYTLGLTPNPLAGIEAKLRNCRIPTRVVWGMADTIFSPDSPDYLAAILPEFRGIRRIAEGKLFFPEVFPALVAEEAVRLWTAENA